MDDSWRSAMALVLLGLAVLLEGEVERAVAIFQEGLAFCQEHDYPWGQAWALYGLGRAAWQQGDTAGALDWLGQSLSRWQAWPQFLFGIEECVDAAAIVAGGIRPDPEPSAAHPERRPPPATLVRAVQLLAATEALRHRRGEVLPPRERPAREMTVQAARAALGERDFAAAWTAGQGMTREQAIAEARAIAGAALADGAAVPGPVVVSARAPLSLREQEVAERIARGLTNREIAAELSISPRTVDRHVENILARLGLTARTQIAAWVARR